MIRQIFEDNYGWLKRFLRVRYFSLNDFDIEDLIQQAILKLLYSDNITGIRNLTAYVFTVLDNGARDHFGKETVKRLSQTTWRKAAKQWKAKFWRRSSMQL